MSSLESNSITIISKCFSVIAFSAKQNIVDISLCVILNCQELTVLKEFCAKQNVIDILWCTILNCQELTVLKEFCAKQNVIDILWCTILNCQETDCFEKSLCKAK